MNIDHINPLLRILADQLGQACNRHDGAAAVSILRQIRVLDPQLGDALVDELVKVGLSRLRDRLAATAHSADDAATLDILARVCAVDPGVASDLITHLRAGDPR